MAPKNEEQEKKKKGVAGTAGPPKNASVKKKTKK
jgi:hypothetical protein